MTLLEIFFIISGVIILLLGIDIAKKERFNALHFLVFLGIGLGLLVFTFFPWFLDIIGRIFGLQRGADVLVYVSIIFLMYFVLLLLSKVEENKHSVTSIVREIAIKSSWQKQLKIKEIILIRVFNEDKVLEKTIDTVLEAWYKNIILIDDGSKDKSWEIISQYALKNENIIWLQHSKNSWAWAALETWFEYVRRYIDCEYIICFDADGQHRISDLDNFFYVFDENPSLEVLLWSRFFKKESYENMPVSRKIILKWWKIFTRIISGAKLTDAHNGYRVFKRGTLDKIRLTTDNMAYASELVDLIVKHKIKYAEVPVKIRYTEYSLSKGQKSSNAISIAFYMIWKKFFR